MEEYNYNFISELTEADLIKDYCEFMEMEIFRVLTIMIIAYLFIFIIYHFRSELGAQMEMVYFRILFIPFSYFAGLILLKQGFNNFPLFNILFFVLFLILIVLLAFNKNAQKYIKIGIEYIKKEQEENKKENKNK